MGKFLKEVLTKDEHLLRHKHNKLKNIQGGISAGILSEYFHLTSCQHTFLTTGIFTDVHKHPHDFEYDENDDLQPRRTEAFIPDGDGNLMPSPFDFDDAYYEEDVNGDVMPKENKTETTCD